MIYKVLAIFFHWKSFNVYYWSRFSIIVLTSFNMRPNFHDLCWISWLNCFSNHAFYQNPSASLQGQLFDSPTNHQPISHCNQFLPLFYLRSQEREKLRGSIERSRSTKSETETKKSNLACSNLMICSQTKN